MPENPPSIEALRLYVIMPYFYLSSIVNDQSSKLKDSHAAHTLLYAYAQSINRLHTKSAARVLDYWFAWTGSEFFKNLINVSFSYFFCF